MYLHSFLLSFYTLCKECNLGRTDKKLHSYTITNISKLTHLIQVSVGAMVNADDESKMFDRGKMGDQSSLPPSTFSFLKLHSYFYTLPPLIKRRNRGVIFFYLYTLYTLSPLFFGKILGPGGNKQCSLGRFISIWHLNLGSHRNSYNTFCEIFTRDGIHANTTNTQLTQIERIIGCNSRPASRFMACD